MITAFEIDGLDQVSLSYRVLLRLARLVPAIGRTAAVYRLGFDRMQV